MGILLLAELVALVCFGTLAYAGDLVIDVPYASSVTVDQSIEAPPSVSVTETMDDGHREVVLRWPSLPGVVYCMWAFTEVAFPDGQQGHVWLPIGSAGPEPSRPEISVGMYGFTAELYGVSVWEESSGGVRISPIRVAQVLAIPTGVTGVSWGEAKSRCGR